MKVPALATIILLVMPSLAQAASDCSTIKNSKARLACFDQANPAQPPQAKASNNTSSGMSNPFAKEDAATSAKMKGICRGC
jgi:hypothetical protein